MNKVIIIGVGFGIVAAGAISLLTELPKIEDHKIINLILVLLISLVICFGGFVYWVSNMPIN